MNYETIKEIHARYNGKCQKCGQSCDKRVISVISDGILCPDCMKGEERPSFKPSEQIIETYANKTGWDKLQIKSFLEVIPYGMALTSYNPNTRMYWNWDKSKPVYIIETDHEGNFLKCQFRGQHLRKIPNSVIIRNEEYKIINDNDLLIKNIEISEEFANSTPNPLKISTKIEEYMEHKEIKNPVYVIRTNQAKRYLLVDGYTTYLASNQLKLKHVNAVFVEPK